MIRSSVFRAVSLSLIAVIAGCAAPQSLEVSRAQTSDQLSQPTALTAASRKFRAAVPFTINFGFDSHELDAEALSRLEEQANWIIDNPQVKVRVYGFADQVGSRGYNIELGQRRAEAVALYFRSRGIAAERLEAAVSFGDMISTVDTVSPERSNRKVVTDVVGRLARAPIQEDGGPALVTRTIVEVAQPHSRSFVSYPPGS